MEPAKDIADSGSPSVLSEESGYATGTDNTQKVKSETSDTKTAKQPAIKSRKRKAPEDAGTKAPAAKRVKSSRSSKTLVKQNDTAQETQDGPEDSSAIEDTNVVQSVAKKSRKRKATDDTTEGTTSKKTKVQPTKAEDAKSEAASPPKPRKPRKSRKAIETIDMPPPPLPPAEVTLGVANKIAQVHDYIQRHPEQRLDYNYDPDHEDCSTIPEYNLQGVIKTMYWHYELGIPAAAPLAEVEEAIIDRSIEKIGTDEVEPQMVLVNHARMTMLEDRIHQNIIRHGLDDKNLLKIELGLFIEALRDRIGSFIPLVRVGAIAATIDETDGDVEAEKGHTDPEVTYASLAAEKEVGRLGVCHPSMQVV